MRQSERSRGFFWHRLRWHVVRGYLPRGRPFRLVDVGAGAGVLGEFLRLEFPHASYAFVEPLGPMETRLEARFGTDANARDLRGYGGVDVVTLLDVLEHQDDDRAFLAELVGKLDRGAALLLTVPANPRLWSRWDDALGHRRRYGRTRLTALLRDLPVQTHEVAYLFPELVPAALARRRLGGGAARTELPELPPLLDDTLYRLGRASLRLRRWWPTGTSLFAAARRT